MGLRGVGILLRDVRAELSQGERPASRTDALSGLGREDQELVSVRPISPALEGAHDVFGLFLRAAQDGTAQIGTAQIGNPTRSARLGDNR